MHIFNTTWYFVSKVVLTYCDKKLFKGLRKIERPDRFLKTECFFNFYNILEKLEFKMKKKIYWDLEIYKKS